MTTESAESTSLGLRSRAKSALDDRENMQRDYLSTITRDAAEEVLQSTIEITSVDLKTKEIYFTVDELCFRMRVSNAFTNNESQVVEMQRDERSWSKVENLVDVGETMRLIEKS